MGFRCLVCSSGNLGQVSGTAHPTLPPPEHEPSRQEEGPGRQSPSPCSDAKVGLKARGRGPKEGKRTGMLRSPNPIGRGSGWFSILKESPFKGKRGGSPSFRNR